MTDLRGFLLGLGLLGALAGCALGPRPGDVMGLTTSSPTPTPAATPLTPAVVERAAHDFFQAYLDCMTAPPAEATGSVSAYCRNHNPYATDDLPANLFAGGVAAAGADPVTCGQNPPNGFQIGAVDIGDAGATATVIAGYLPQDLQITLTLEDRDGSALVSNVTCPTP